MGCEITTQRKGWRHQSDVRLPAGRRAICRNRHQGLHSAGSRRPGLLDVRAPAVRPAFQGKLRRRLDLAARGFGGVRRPQAHPGRRDGAGAPLSQPAHHPGHHDLLDGSHRRRHRRQYQILQRHDRRGIPRPRSLCRSGPHAELQEQPGRRLFRMRCRHVEDHRQGKGRADRQAQHLPGLGQSRRRRAAEALRGRDGRRCRRSSWTPKISTRRCCPTSTIHTHGRTTVEDIKASTGALASLSLARYEAASYRRLSQEEFRRSRSSGFFSLWHRQHRRHAEEDLRDHRQADPGVA